MKIHMLLCSWICFFLESWIAIHIADKKTVKLDKQALNVISGTHWSSLDSVLSSSLVCLVNKQAQMSIFNKPDLSYYICWEHVCDLITSNTAEDSQERASWKHNIILHIIKICKGMKQYLKVCYLGVFGWISPLALHVRF